MKEQNLKPILFSTPMVQALLDGRKTMTRRVAEGISSSAEFKSFGYIDSNNNEMARFMLPKGTNVFIRSKCVTDDILWVRETWRIGAWNENWGAICVDYKADGYANKEWIKIENEDRFDKYWIESTDDASNAGLPLDEDVQYSWEPGKGPTRWRPSIFMPREAARIFLRVTEVKAERVQDISEEDAKAEGAIYTDYGEYQPTYKASFDGSKTYYEAKPQHHNGWSMKKTNGPDECYYTARQAFAGLWQELNAKRGYGWDKNPWVWVISFERCEKPNSIAKAARDAATS